MEILSGTSFESCFHIRHEFPKEKKILCQIEVRQSRKGMEKKHRLGCIKKKPGKNIRCPSTNLYELVVCRRISGCHPTLYRNGGDHHEGNWMVAALMVSRLRSG